jgi:6-phosphogluconolactonase
MDISRVFGKTFTRAAWLTVASSALAAPVLAGTFVYVSNAQDGDISTYTMQPNGSLVAGERVKVAGTVMPMAVSANKHFLYAASRAKPFSLHAYAINSTNGGLTHLSTVPAAESFPYISLDKTGRFLLGSSYGGNLVSVNAVGADGRVMDPPLQVIPVGRNAHSIRLDDSNKFAYVATLGSDAVFQFTFDNKTGKLTSNTPPVAMMKAGSGPRHFVTSNDNKYMYLLSEMAGTVTTMAIDAKTGLLSEVSQVSGLSPDSKLTPGMADRNTPRNKDNDIWAADIHLTPDGKFIYTSERTNSTLNVFSVDSATGKLTYMSSTPTETGPRGFAIDAKGRYLVASGEKSETISVYAIAGGNGALDLVGKYPVGKGANWVEVVSFD